MEQSPTSKADSFSISQIPRIFVHPKIHNSPQLVRIYT